MADSCPDSFAFSMSSARPARVGHDRAPPLSTGAHRGHSTRRARADRMRRLRGPPTPVLAGHAPRRPATPPGPSAPRDSGDRGLLARRGTQPGAPTRGRAARRAAPPLTSGERPDCRFAVAGFDASPRAAPNQARRQKSRRSKACRCSEQRSRRSNPPRRAPRGSPRAGRGAHARSLALSCWSSGPTRRGARARAAPHRPDRRPARTAKLRWGRGLGSAATNDDARTGKPGPRVVRCSRPAQPGENMIG